LSQEIPDILKTCIPTIKFTGFNGTPPVQGPIPRRCTTEIQAAVMRQIASIWHQDTAPRIAMQDSELLYHNSDIR